MSRGPFNRLLLNRHEHVREEDHNLLQTHQDYALRHVLQMLLGFSEGVLSDLHGMAHPLPDGFVGDSFRVIPGDVNGNDPMDVEVLAGVGFFTHASGTLADGEDAVVQDYPIDVGGDPTLGVDDTTSYKPVVKELSTLFTVPGSPTAPDDLSGAYRVDLIEVRVNRHLEDVESRKKLNTTSGAYVDTDMAKVLSFLCDGNETGTVTAPTNSTAGLSYKVGPDPVGGVTTWPTLSPGYNAVAWIAIPERLTPITEVSWKRIIDKRVLALPGGIATGPISFEVQDATTAPTDFVVGQIPGVEVYPVADDTEIGRVTVYVVCNFPKAALSLNVEYNGVPHAVHVSAPVVDTVDNAAQTAIASARNAAGATDVGPEAGVIIFTVIVREIAVAAGPTIGFIDISAPIKVTGTIAVAK